ncbi:MAG TPA: vitamin K epoxide reductase family protein [Vicinamibacterales bacterium]|nr:vitamin K epoxide reductase family protein [Vicinamibacterales bacterium]
MTPVKTMVMAAFAALGLSASAASTWVHYRILNDPTYASFCDVNATFSCTEAYTSRFGAVAGVPIALVGLLFFAGVLGLIALGGRSAATRENLAGYLFVLSTLGLAAVLYLAYASYFILNVVCVLCVGTYVAVLGLFLLSGASTRFPMTSLPKRAMNDLRTPGALTAAILFLAVSAAAIVWFPEQRVTAAAGEPAAGQAAGQPAAPGQIPAADPGQVQKLEQYLSAQPRIPVMVPSDGAAVVVLKFNDYQCPGCGQTYRDYKAVIAKWNKEAPGKLKFITKDYPLERECNQFAGGDLHPGACEAAVAVRLAREKGKGESMEDWLVANQPALNPETVKKAAATVGGVTDFDKRYAAQIELVKADIAHGQQLKVTGTPTFFVNGMRLPGMRPEYFDAVIAWEMKRVAAAK